MKNQVDLTIPTAVLIVDVQNSMFDEVYPVYQSAKMLERIKEIEDFAVKNNLVSLYIQHSGAKGSPEERGTESWKLHSALSLNGLVFEKTTFSAFESTNLNSVLIEKGIKQLIVCGMQTDYCIEANCTAGAKLGYQVVLVKDAHSTCDSEEKTAADIIESMNVKLSEIARLISTEDLITP